MKKINIIFAIVALALITISCETYDDYEKPREIVVGFTTSTATLTVADGEEKTTTLNIFSSEATNADRTLNVVVVEGDTELASENYTFDPTVTIPANEREASIEFTGFGVSLTEEGEVVTLRIQRDGSYVSGGPAAVTVKN